MLEASAFVLSVSTVMPSVRYGTLRSASCILLASPGRCMAYWRLHYHLVWATDEREPSIDAAIADVIHRVMYGKAKELGLVIHAVGGVEDHLHIVVSVPPKLALADCVGKLKGASSHAVNLGRQGAAAFRCRRDTARSASEAGRCQRSWPTFATRSRTTRRDPSLECASAQLRTTMEFPCWSNPPSPSSRQASCPSKPGSPGLLS